MIYPFAHTGSSAKVVFGPGRISELRAEVNALALERVLVLSTPQQTGLAEQACTILGDLAVGIFSGARMHTPVEVTAEAEAKARELCIDAVVSVGGGSTIGLGKALVARMGVSHIAVPTTYAGSEMTPILGETANGAKVTTRDEKLRPRTVIYDADLTLGLPVAMSVTSAINAAAHAVEALYAKDRNPLVSLMAAESLRAISAALPRITRDETDSEARAEALYGAWLAGSCLGAVSMSFHHKLCHTLGGMYDLPHAETHTVILPHAIAFIAPAEPDAMRRIAAALGRADAARGIFDLVSELGGPRSLQELGMREEQLDRAADEAVKNPYWTPVPLERDAIRSLLGRAFRGEAPA